jgi:hypothetical protein
MNHYRLIQIIYTLTTMLVVFLFIYGFIGE